MTDILSEVTRNLRRDNPMYGEFLFDKTKDFLKGLYANGGMAPKGSYATRSDLLFAAGQGFLTGYGAGIDGEYDAERTEVSPDVADEPWWREAVRSLGDMEVRPFVLARASKFASTVMALGNSDPFAYYSSYGFVIGMEQGITGLSTGEVDYLADDDAERKRTEDMFRHEARLAADEIMLPDLLRINAALGFFNGVDETEEDIDDFDVFAYADDEDDEDDEDDADVPIRYDDEGWETSTTEYGEFGELMRTVASAATAYVASVGATHSGWNHVDGKVVRNRMMTYVAYYIDGYCDQAFRRVPDERTLAAYARESEGLRQEFARPFGTDYSIDQDIAFGRLPAGDAELAKAAARHILDDILGKLLEVDPMLVLRSAKSLSDLPVPDAEDAFWGIAAVAYAHGVRKSEEEGREVSEEGLAMFSYALENMAYEGLDDEEFEFDYGDVDGDFEYKEDGGFSVFGGAAEPEAR